MSERVNLDATPDLPPVAESSSETANTPADCVWVVGEDG